MRLHLFVLVAGISLAGCDAPAPTPVSDPNLAAQTRTSVVSVPDTTSGPAVSPPADTAEQRVSSVAEPQAKDLKVIQFAVGSDAMSDVTNQQLSRFGRYLTKFRKAVVLTGYTRRMPDLAAANDPSVRRAQAVRRYLILHDVSAASIESTGLGDAHPVDQGTTEEAMARNDRVELELIDAKPADTQ